MVISDTKICDKRDDFNFNIGNFPHLDDEVPRAISCGVHISQLIRFSREGSHVKLNERTCNYFITSKLLFKHKLRAYFTMFYYKNYKAVQFLFINRL